MLAHYYGWTNDEIESLSPDDFSTYLLALDVIDSRQVLRGCTVSDWPNMKSKDRSALYRKLSKAAMPVREKKSSLTTEDFARIVGAVSNGRK